MSRQYTYREIEDLYKQKKSSFKSIKDGSEDPVRVIIEDIYGYFNNIGVAINDNVIDDRNRIIDEVTRLIYDICEMENVSPHQIERIGHGATSFVYQIGDLIVKLGSRPIAHSIPENPYVLFPYYRKGYEVEDETIECIFVQVVDKVETLEDSEVTEEELYELYAKFRDIGLEWLDISARNVGKLIKDNKMNMMKPIIPDSEDMLVYTGEKTLKAGELVVLDTDFIYKKEEVPEEYFHQYEDNEYYFVKTVNKFRERYEKEQRRKKSVIFVPIQNAMKEFSKRLKEKNNSKSI